jgi:hypothetical protein
MYAVRQLCVVLSSTACCTTLCAHRVNRCFAACADRGGLCRSRLRVRLCNGSAPCARVPSKTRLMSYEPSHWAQLTNWSNWSNRVTPLGRMRCARTACAPTCWSPSASRTQSAAVTNLMLFPWRSVAQHVTKSTSVVLPVGGVVALGQACERQCFQVCQSFPSALCC